ncbi:MAG: GAF domain-containing sensor histidine kinase [Anaerolineae bacterium]
MRRRISFFIARLHAQFMFVGAVALLVVLFALLITYALPSFVSSLNTALLLPFALVAFGVFAVACYGLVRAFDPLLHPEQHAYPRFAERYGTLRHEPGGDARAFFQLAGEMCFITLDPASVAVWRFDGENNVLRPVYFTGTRPPVTLDDVPVDLDLTRSPQAIEVGTLPESALRHSWIAQGMHTVCPLLWGKELIGAIGLGTPRYGSAYTRAALQWLDWLASQVALAVKNVCLADEMEETRTRLQMAYRQTIEVQEEERRSLAVELHDDILSRLTAMSLTLRNCRRRIGDNDQQVEAWLSNLEQETNTIVQRLREITQGLHPTVLSNLGLIAAVQAYLDHVAHRPSPNACVVSLTAQGFGGDRLPDARIERDLYHITRQALDNALIHAHADYVFVHFRWSFDTVSVTVRDTGQGMAEPPERLIGRDGHLGLISMHERARAWGGRLMLESQPGRGTTVRVSIPVNQPSRSPAHLEAYVHYLSPSATG